MRIVCFFQILKVFIINLSPEIQVIAHNKTDINRDKIYFEKFIKEILQ